MLNLLIGFSMNCLNSYISKRKAGEDTTFKIFDGNLFSDKKQFLCFFVMAFSSLRLLSYVITGLIYKFKIPKSHKFIGLAVYGVFVVSFVFFEFVAFRGSD